jgi:hypothetical protein
MLPGPIFRREVKVGARRRDLFGMRIALATLMGAVTVVPALVIFGATPQHGRKYSFESIRDYWLVVFAGITGVEIVCTVPWTPGGMGPTFAQELEKNTLPLLLLTRLTRLELIVTKLAGRLMPPFMLMASGLPLLLF